MRSSRGSSGPPLIASSRIARGAGFRQRRLFAACVDRTLGALSEIAYHLEMAG